MRTASGSYSTRGGRRADGLERALRREVRDRQGLLGQEAEEPLDLVQPRRTRRRVVELHARMGGEPGADLVGVVRRGVVEDDVKVAVGIGAGDRLHEPQE